MKKIICFLFVMLCAFLVTGCNDKSEKAVNKIDKYGQLSNYLINNGWKKDENSQYDFTLKKRDILDEKERPINIDWYFLNIKKMNIQRMSRISQFFATTTDYSLKSNIATGTYILLNEDDEWDKYVSFTYDFNSGTLTSNDNSSSSSCTSQALGLKEYLEEIIENADLSIEDFK